MIHESEFHDVDAYFQYQLADNERFWSRLGGRPDLRGKFDVLRRVPGLEPYFTVGILSPAAIR